MANGDAHEGLKTAGMIAGIASVALGFINLVRSLFQETDHAPQPEEPKSEREDIKQAEALAHEQRFLLLEKRVDERAAEFDRRLSLLEKTKA